MIFIVSSTGIFIYKTHCLCTGTEQVGIYLKPETCEENYHVHHTHDASGTETSTNENLCHECSHQNHDCGCASPEVRFFKLSNDLTQDEVSFDRAPGVKITDIILTSIVCFEEQSLIADSRNKYIELPPKIKSAKSFLIQVNQLKIPHAA